MARTFPFLQERDMITDKLRILALSLVLVICLAAFSACSGDDDSAFELLDAMKDEASNQTEQAQYDKYLVVIPASSTSELSLIARDLADKIEQKTGIECEYKYDNADVSVKEKRFDILLGNTGRRESVDNLGKFKKDDYVCKLLDGCIVLGGLSDAATVVAVQKFIDDVLPNATAGAIMSASSGFEHRGEYELGDVLLCGYDIRDYTIVFSGADVQTMAIALRDLVADQSGIYLGIKSGKVNTSSDKEIFLSIDTSADACVKHVGEDVYIIGKDAYSLSAAISGFYNMLLESKTNGVVSLDISDKLDFSYTQPLLRITSVIADITNDENSLSYISSYVNAINSGALDVTVLGKYSSDMWGMIKPAINTAYGIVEIELANGIVAPIVYLGDTVSVVDSKLISADDVQVARIEFKHVATNESYVLYVFLTDLTDCSAVAQTIKSSDNAVAMVCVPKASANIQPDDGVSTAYNGSVDLSGTEHSLIWQTANSNVTFENVKSACTNRIHTVSFEICARYCADYRALMS